MVLKRKTQKEDEVKSRHRAGAEEGETCLRQPQTWGHDSGMSLTFKAQNRRNKASEI
jgi:hypothetical protein